MEVYFVGTIGRQPSYSWDLWPIPIRGPSRCTVEKEGLSLCNADESVSVSWNRGRVTITRRAACLVYSCLLFRLFRAFNIMLLYLGGLLYSCGVPIYHHSTFHPINSESTLFLWDNGLWYLKFGGIILHAILKLDAIATPSFHTPFIIYNYIQMYILGKKVLIQFFWKNYLNYLEI